MKLATKLFTLPSHWACALINDDRTGLTDEEELALDGFIEEMIKGYGKCWPIACSDEESFSPWHDAMPYGVLACDCVDVTFDVTPA
jgi:hypothetical protein